ncbi:Rad4 beta-hairpin domain 3 [Phytophthora cactorum]|nr:Rad4 beta-hairpin domain 3 [Phytophthora cactorum]
MVIEVSVPWLHIPSHGVREENEEFAYSAGELEDDEEDDVDWEDVGPSQQDSDPLIPQPAASISPSVAHETASNIDDEPEDEPDEPAQNWQKIDWEQVNQSLAKQDAASATRKRRRPPIRLTKDEKQREMALHQTHLLVLLATRIKWKQLSRSQVLRGLLLSLTATSDVDFFADMRQQPLSYSLELLVRWFNREYKISDEVEEYATQGELITESSLMNVFFARQGRDYELAVLFAALCGALQLRYRLTCAGPVAGAEREDVRGVVQAETEQRRRAQNVADRLKKKLLSGDAEEKREVDEELEPESTGNVRRVFWLWCEVLDEKHKNWIHVDAVRRLVNRPQEVEPLRGKAARFSYVVSIQDDGLLVDVTSRYTVQLVAEAMIERFNEDTTDQRPVTEAQQDWRDLETWKMLSDEALQEGKPSGSLAFFGLWQTTEFEPPPMVDGRSAHVPRGAVHLHLPRIDAIAESLGIDFAPAVVGFEVRNGRPMPKMSGIVVAQSHEEMLLDAHAERQQQTIEKAIAHNQKLVLKRWEKLTKRLLLRQRLEDDYGAVAAFSTRAEWKRQVAEGPRLQDFLSTSRARDDPSSAAAQDEIHQILAEIRQAPRQETSQLLDRFGRAHTYLHGVPLQPTEELLTTSEITRLAKVFASSGVKRIRLTGGEPLLRRDLVELVAQLRAIPGIESVGITTNGITLQKKLLALQQAGVDRLNVSLDTLKPDKFAHITRRQGFTRVMNSILEAQTLGFSPLKINCVVQRRFNLDEIVDFVAFTEKHAVDVRFIEWMPFDSNRWNDETFVPFKEMMGLIQAEFPL